MPPPRHRELAEGTDAPGRYRHWSPSRSTGEDDGKVPRARWVEVANYLTDKPAEGILAQEDGPAEIADSHVVDTRGTLVPADLGSTGDSNDRQNEIHSNGPGYEKLPIKVEAQLEPLLTGT